MDGYPIEKVLVLNVIVSLIFPQYTLSLLAGISSWKAMENRALFFIIFYAQVWYVALELIQLNWHLKAPPYTPDTASAGWRQCTHSLCTCYHGAATRQA